MPTPSLPSYVKISASSLSIKRQPAIIRTDMESGPPKQSKILSRVLVTRKVNFLFSTKTDYNNFITWFISDISRGADWFTWTDPVDSVSKLARIVGGVLESETPRSGNSNLWEISCSLETWDE